MAVVIWSRCPSAARGRAGSSKAAKKTREIGRELTGPAFTAFDLQGCGMKRVTRQKKLALQFRSPTGLDELEIMLFVRPINLVADDGMTGRSQVHANLVSATGLRESANEAEMFFVRAAREACLNPKIRASGRAQRMNGLLEPNR